jgi:protein tyrosine/serine phosphatase
MQRSLFVLALVAAAPACAVRTQPTETPQSTADILASLYGPQGPAHFGVVHAGLYRGGQPTSAHLEQLHALGVTKVIDLRRERLDLRWAERATARQLGMEFVELPFFGVFGADPAFLERIVDEMDTPHDGAIYVHCDNGSDRTSLAVALYRVEVEGWDPQRAWQSEALDYGHRPRKVMREIELAFREQVHEQALLRNAATLAPERRRAAAEIQNGLVEAVPTGARSASLR